MEIAINEAKGKLSGLIKAAMGGEQVLLTKHGRPVAEIKPFAAAKTKAEKLALLKKVAAEATTGATTGAKALAVEKRPDAAHASDFLYDNGGMPS
jgi:prevent-host-death family protein